MWDNFISKFNVYKHNNNEKKLIQMFWWIIELKWKRIFGDMAAMREINRRNHGND